MSEGEKLVFATAFEGLYLRGLKGQVTPALRAELKGLGLDLERPLLPAYPLAIWAEGLRCTGAALFPDRSRDDGIAQLGRAAVDGLRETALGRALFPVFRILGPQRLLRRMTRNLQNGSNFIETRLVQDVDRDVAIWFNLVREPGFYLGVLAAGVEAAGGAGPEVSLAERQGESCVYRVRWG